MSNKKDKGKHHFIALEAVCFVTFEANVAPWSAELPQKN